MAKIHPNWLIHHHEGDDKAALVKDAKQGTQGLTPRKPTERAVKPAAPETRKGKRS